MSPQPRSETSPESRPGADATWLVTGAAGFIGMHLCQRLVADGRPVVAVDNLEPTYEPALKRARLARLRELPDLEWHEVDVADAGAVDDVVARSRPAVIVHLAARAGVRGSHLDPLGYVRTNVTGFADVLEAARLHGVGHVVFASSSSVYGDTSPLPFAVAHPADHPISVYAATKRSDELLAHSWAHVYGLPVTGLRLFTVYGPWGRPDMAYFAFADAILDGRPLTIFGDGTALRDFTYVDDVVDAIVELGGRAPRGAGTVADGGAQVPWRLYNIGHGSQASVNELIQLLEERLGRAARREHRETHLGDVRTTHADTTPLRELVGSAPSTTLEVGLDRFVEWLVEYRADHPSPTSGTG